MLNKQKDNINQIRKANHIILRKQFCEILDGLLMGDGTLSTQRENISAYYEHGDKKLNYLIWVSYLFARHGVKQSGKIYPMRQAKNGAYKYKTLSYFEFGEIRERWYPNNKKTIPIDLTITPSILKFWYISDGNFSRQPLIDSTIFSFEDLKRISEQLDFIGIEHSLREFKDRKRIRIFSNSEQSFFDYINSDGIKIPYSYKYKFSEV